LQRDDGEWLSLNLVKREQLQSDFILDAIE